MRQSPACITPYSSMWIGSVPRRLNNFPPNTMYRPCRTQLKDKMNQQDGEIDLVCEADGVAVTRIRPLPFLAENPLPVCRPFQN